MATKDQYTVAVVNEINLAKTSVTIAANGTDSTVLNCGAVCPTGVFLPASLVNCNLSFYVSKTPNGTFYPVCNFDGSDFSIVGLAGNFVPLSPAMFNSALYLQVISDTSQTAGAVIDFALCPIFQGIHT